MPSPYELKTRWLEWHERWPVPEIESLKRQIDCIKLEIERCELTKIHAPMVPATDLDEVLACLREVLATLERLMPPF